jgi:hypothetical protein
MSFTAVGLKVITDPIEVEKFRVMRRVRSNYEAIEAWGHIMPKNGGWNWVVKLHGNVDSGWDSEGSSQDPETAYQNMTKALQRVSNNPDAAWTNASSPFI